MLQGYTRHTPIIARPSWTAYSKVEVLELRESVVGAKHTVVLDLKSLTGVYPAG